MANTTGRRRSAGRGPEGEVGPAVEGESWEQRHIRVTFWLEQTLRDEVRDAAKAGRRASPSSSPRLCDGPSTSPSSAAAGNHNPRRASPVKPSWNVTLSRVPELVTGSLSPWGQHRQLLTMCRRAGRGRPRQRHPRSGSSTRTGQARDDRRRGSAANGVPGREFKEPSFGMEGGSG